MPQLEYWKPVAPPEAERRYAEWRQGLALFRTLRSLWCLAREDFSPAHLDGHLRDYRGFHQDPQSLQYRMRPWQQTKPRESGPCDVVGIAPSELALMFQIAMENEEPIPAYTRQSGEGFRFLLPSLARFMGVNREEARHLAEQGLTWCVGPWCAEEHRHSNMLARLIEIVTGRPPKRDNPNQPIQVTSDEQAALEHFNSRQTTEWNASSSYLVMAAHTRGELHKIVRNLQRDEIKHLTILGAAHCYLFGWQPWRRFATLLRTGIGNYKLQRERRSGGELLGANPVTAIEGIVAHMLTEFLLRQWLRTVPLRSLRAIFEAPSRVPALGVTDLPEREAERVRETSLRESVKRVSLGRWLTRQRQNAEKQARIEKENEAEVAAQIRDRWDGFQQAGSAGSSADRALRSHIRKGIRSRHVRSVLIERLRDYQIRGTGLFTPNSI